MAAFLTLVDPPSTGSSGVESDDGTGSLIGDDDSKVISDTSNESARLFDVEDIKTHLRITNTLEDDYILTLIDAATAMLDGRDGWLGRALITQTWRLTLDHFRCDHRYNDWHRRNKIILPLPPLQSVSSVKYIDTNGTQQTLDPSLYSVIDDAEPGYIVPAYNTFWPGTRHQPAAVEIEYVCGYGEAEAVPAAIKHYLKLMIGDFYRDRETTNLGNTANPLPWICGMLENFRIRGALQHDGWAS